MVPFYPYQLNRPLNIPTVLETMIRNLFLSALATLLTASACAASEKPNILFIVCDDLNTHESTSGYKWPNGEELYDLSRDPFERNNLAAEEIHSARLQHFRGLLVEQRELAASYRKQEPTFSDGPLSCQSPAVNTVKNAGKVHERWRHPFLAPSLCGHVVGGVHTRLGSIPTLIPILSGGCPIGTLAQPGVGFMDSGYQSPGIKRYERSRYASYCSPNSSSNIRSSGPIRKAMMTSMATTNDGPAT